MNLNRWYALSAFCFVLFWGLTRYAQPSMASANVVVDDRVVVPATVQVIMAGGDRFLAADVESIRSAVLYNATEESESLYRIRAHKTISHLNPCHEDNYYIGNALLTWGGAVSAGNELLLNATECRIWDYIPPYFYALNSYFFTKKTVTAQKYLEIAAQRSPEHYASLKKTAIMITVEEFDDLQIALSYLQQELDNATDVALRLMLKKRIERLNGLIILRSAQKKYEKHYNHTLRDPMDLINKGILNQFPLDPLGIGYEFNNDVFVLGQKRVPGIGNR